MDATPNILAIYDQATPGEREEGASWFEKAHSVARALAVVSRLDVRRAAALLAALSPLNRWEDNVSDAFSLARDVRSRVRTPHPNRWKGIRILAGEDPAEVLRGPKILAFYEAVADPVGCRRIAVDRHLYRAAVGLHVPPRVAAPRSMDEYRDIENAYCRAAFSVYIPPSSLASTIWLAMRRLTSSGSAGQLWIEGADVAPLG